METPHDEETWILKRIWYMVRTMTKKNAIASESASAYTGHTECRNINGERRTTPQLVSTLSRQNQCDLNLLHPLQHPLDRSMSPRACVPICLPACPVSLSLSNFLFMSSFITGSSLPLLHSMECVLRSPTRDTSCYFFLSLLPLLLSWFLFLFLVYLFCSFLGLISFLFL